LFKKDTYIDHGWALPWTENPNFSTIAFERKSLLLYFMNQPQKYKHKNYDSVFIYSV